MTDREYLNNSIREKIVKRVKNGFLDGAGGYLKAMDYYAKGLISLDTVKIIDDEIKAWEEAKYIVPEPPVEEPIEDVPTEETEIEDETILDDEEGTETEITTDETVENTYLDENIF